MQADASTSLASLARWWNQVSGLDEGESNPTSGLRGRAARRGGE